MSCPFHFGSSRRGLLGAAAALAGASVLAARPASAEPADEQRVLPFHGPRQNGIATPSQAHLHFAAFDIVADKLADVAGLMRTWTEAAARLTQGLAVGTDADAPDRPTADSGEATDLPPSRLTLTFGFGPGLFSKDGVDRFGLQKHRPEAFVDLPNFPGDQLAPERTGGDLCVQACGDDPQACFHAVRQLMRLAYGVANVRWVQAGFQAGFDAKQTPRNLMGFRDGTANVAVDDLAALEKFVFVGDEGGAWMRGGSYMVARPIRIAVEHWDRMKLMFQEQTVGRHKVSGAPIGATDEFATADLDATDGDGNPVIAENAHIRLASPVTNNGVKILRRGYSYDNGVSMVAERWPPWRHALELDAGLMFVCYQRDPRTGFIGIFERMSRFDMMNQFVTHVGGGMFACPGGAMHGRYLGQELFEAI
jgi:deferrochelatase/peroxidase EfeB